MVKDYQCVSGIFMITGLVTFSPTSSGNIGDSGEDVPDGVFGIVAAQQSQTDRSLFWLECYFEGQELATLALEGDEFDNLGQYSFARWKDKLESILQFAPLQCLLKKLFDYVLTTFGELVR
ncbi:MAG TPA: hypothetical protein VF493_01790 [Terriglobales bacterium]